MPPTVQGWDGYRDYAADAGDVDRTGIFRVSWWCEVPRTDRRALRRQHHRVFAWRNVYQSQRDYEQHVPQPPRRPDRRIPPDPAAGTGLGVGGDREPLHNQTRDAYELQRGERAQLQTIHADCGDGLREARAPRTQKEQPVEEMIGLFLMRCCAGDGGRSSVVALQEGATNHREVRRSRAVRAERYGKGVPLSASGVTQ